METYNPDDELQQLREWLRDNGPALLAGLLLGALLVGGWSGWKYYTARQSLLASIEFGHLHEVLQSGDAKHAEEVTAKLTTQYSRTPYAALASLELAADQVKRGQFESALKQYQWAAHEAKDRKLRHIARLRGARLLWNLGRSEEALAELQAHRQGSFAPLFAELRGDILAARGQPEEARQAYAEALASEASTPEQRASVELKLNDLNPQGSTATGTNVVPKDG